MTFGTTEYYYNSRNRLERITLPDGRIATYTYDPFGRRIKKDVAGQVTYYAYSDEGLIGEYDQNGNLSKGYGWMPGSTWGTNPVFMVEGGNYYFYQNDHLGTPQKLTDINGNTVWSAIYMAFGNAEVQVSTITNNLRFPGQYLDEETGLHYNWHRYYDPAIGRYTQEDPIGFKGGINYYLYVKANPINHKDPYGMDEQTGTCYDQYLKLIEKCNDKMDKGPGRIGVLECVELGAGIGIIVTLKTGNIPLGIGVGCVFATGCAVIPGAQDAVQKSTCEQQARRIYNICKATEE